MFREERVPGGMPINDGTNCEQLMLFRKRLAWQELPRGIRDSTIDLVTTLCVEIAMELVIQEQDNESDEDYPLVLTAVQNCGAGRANITALGW